MKWFRNFDLKGKVGFLTGMYKGETAEHCTAGWDVGALAE
jgi:hypothetical protein